MNSYKSMWRKGTPPLDTLENIIGNLVKYNWQIHHLKMFSHSRSQESVKQLKQWNTLFACEVTKTESGHYNVGGPVCWEMDSIRGYVKRYTGGVGMQFNLAIRTKNLKITTPSNLEFPLCVQNIFILQVSFITAMLIEFFNGNNLNVQQQKDWWHKCGPNGRACSPENVLV